MMREEIQPGRPLASSRRAPMKRRRCTVITQRAAVCRTARRRLCPPARSPYGLSRRQPHDDEGRLAAPPVHAWLHPAHRVPGRIGSLMPDAGRRGVGWRRECSFSRRRRALTGHDHGTLYSWNDRINDARFLTPPACACFIGALWQHQDAAPALRHCFVHIAPRHARPEITRVVDE